MAGRNTSFTSAGRLVLFALLGAGLIGLAMLQLNRARQEPPGSPRDQRYCHGGKLGAQGREQALSQGYVIDATHDCISRVSYLQVQQQLAERAATARRLEAERALAEQRQAAQAQPASERTLAEARRGFKTAVAVSDLRRQPLPNPPEALYVRADYVSAGRTLAAFVTPAPRDGRRLPAVIWLGGGDTNTLGDFWVRGAPGRDESAQALRQAGLVVMFPTLRGGNTNPGTKELGMGEVDDVLAAAEHLARLPYVDPAQIYLAGHSTGGTLALLVAQLSTRFAAVLALGPAADVRDYGATFGNGIEWRALLNADDEVALRSPGRWMGSIRSATYVIEGKQSPSNLHSLAAMCEHAERTPRLRCLQVPGYDHFSIVEPVTKVAAAQMLIAGPEHFRLSVEQLKRPEPPPGQ
jgi:alpha/beta superfamily hydrolase